MLRTAGRDVEALEMPVKLDSDTLSWQAATDQYGLIPGSVEEQIFIALQDLEGIGTASRLAQLTGKQRPHVVRALNGLERRGLVTKTETHGRATTYILTEHDTREMLW